MIACAGASYGVQDTTTSALGYIFLSANLALSVSRGVLQRYMYSSMRQSIIGIAGIETTLSVPLVVGLCYISGEWYASEDDVGTINAAFDAAIDSAAPSPMLIGLKKPWRAWSASDDVTWKYMVIITSFFVGFIGISYTQLFRYLAATTVTVINSVDKTISVVVGAFMFGDIIGFSQGSALALTLIGGGAYVFLRKHRLQSTTESIEPASLFGRDNYDDDDDDHLRMENRDNSPLLMSPREATDDVSERLQHVAADLRSLSNSTTPSPFLFFFLPLLWPHSV
jgi:hypothetical protein